MVSSLASVSTAVNIIGFRLHCCLRGRQRAVAGHEKTKESSSLSITRPSEAREATQKRRYLDNTGW